MADTKRYGKNGRRYRRRKNGVLYRFEIITIISDNGGHRLLQNHWLHELIFSLSLWILKKYLSPYQFSPVYLSRHSRNQKGAILSRADTENLRVPFSPRFGRWFTGISRAFVREKSLLETQIFSPLTSSEKIRKIMEFHSSSGCRVKISLFPLFFSFFFF